MQRRSIIATRVIITFNPIERRKSKKVFRSLICLVSWVKIGAVIKATSAAITNGQEKIKCAKHTNIATCCYLINVFAFFNARKICHTCSWRREPSMRRKERQKVFCHLNLFDPQMKFSQPRIYSTTCRMFLSNYTPVQTVLFSTNFQYLTYVRKLNLLDYKYELYG